MFGLGAKEEKATKRQKMKNGTFAVGTWLATRNTVSGFSGGLDGKTYED